MSKQWLPSSLKRWVNRICIDFVLHHRNEVSELGKLEMGNSVSYEELHRRYYSKLASMHYEYNPNEQPTRVIWWCWLQGEESAPPLCKACLNSIREHLDGFEIKVITEQNMLEFVHFPQFILNKYKKGIISRTHFSDILRTLLLVEWGSVWIDSTVYCTGYNSKYFDYPLFVFQNWKFDIPQSMAASSWLISAKKNNPILRVVLELLYEYWKENDKLLDYYLFHFFFKMAADCCREQWESVSRFSNIPPHILQFEMFDAFDEERFRQIRKMSDFHKLTWKHNLESKNLTGTFFERIVMKG